MKISLPALVLILSLVASANGGCPTGDLHPDCRIDLLDLQLFALNWLDEDCSAPDCPANLDGVTGLDMADFAILAGNWGMKGRCSPVRFSHDRGFYESSFQLTLSTEMTAVDLKIMYTTDGSRPGQTSGTEYIPGSDITIDKTTVIRALVVRPGWLDSNIATHTYIFCVDVRYQSLSGDAPSPDWPLPGYSNIQLMDYGMDPKIVLDDHRYAGEPITDALESIATISLVTDTHNLFDPSEGIYVNAHEQGRLWERPCSLELIYPPNPQGPGFPDLVKLHDPDGQSHWSLPPDMRDGFQVNAGVRIRGGFSRSGSNPKHAFRFFFRSEYGNEKLRYPLFGDEGVDTFDHIDLRCSQNYSWSYQGDNKNTMVRDVFSRDMQGLMGQPYTRSRYYHLYINGLYWGLYQSQERSEATWAQSYMGGDKEDYDVVVSANWSQGRIMLPTDGDRNAFDRLYNEATGGLRNYKKYYRLQGLNIDGTPNPGYEKLLDVENLIDFMIIEYYTGDADGPGSRFGGIPNNTWCVFNRCNPDGWKWLHHDNEHTLGAGGPGGSVENLVKPFTTAGSNPAYFNPHWLHEQLISANVDYRMKFADRIHRHFHNDGLLTVDKCQDSILNRAQQIDMAIIAESARWGDAKHSSWAHTRDDHWWPEIIRLLYETLDPWGRKTYPALRTETVLEQFKSAGWYPDVNPPVFSSLAQHIFMGNPNAFGTIYYTLDGTDPRIPVAQSAPGPGITLIAENDQKYYLVPTVANGGNLLANTPLQFDVTYYKANIAVGNLATAESVIANPALQSQVIHETSPVIDYNNTYCPGRFPKDRPVPGPAEDLDDYVLEITAPVRIPMAGEWTFGVHCDAGFSLRLTGPDSFYMEYPSSRTPADSFAVFDIATLGTYDLRLVYFERQGWSGVELFAARGSSYSFNSDFRLIGDIAGGGLQTGSAGLWFTGQFDHSAWSDGTGGLGYETIPTEEPNYLALFKIDLEDRMFDDGANPAANTSCYVRIPFDCTHTEYNTMVLKIRYDDGFIAYLNGSEVARRNFPLHAPADWNSSTYPDRHDDVSAIEFEDMDISDRIELLRTGNNILAIHAMNYSTEDPDFLISAELIANETGKGDINSDALVYNSFFMLDKSTHIRGRVLDGKKWSPLTDMIYSIGPVKENLRITEIMYHPPDPTQAEKDAAGDPNLIDEDFEFIELQNIGVAAINLNLVNFTDGIDFTFTDYTLAAGDYTVLVKNQAAFAARYNTAGINIVPGSYTGSLDNGGEEIVLRDAIGTEIHDFDYNDTWYDITDGAGFSLTIKDADAADPNLWDQKVGWRPSAAVDGSPGWEDTGDVPEIGAIVINEILAHTDLSPNDWIELHNTTGSLINIGDWYLSDDAGDLTKYKIAPGTSIAAGGYIVFTQDDDFGGAFALSENGETLYLHSGNGSELTGYSEEESFGASENNVAFGRYEKTTGTFNFVAMSSNTPGGSYEGAANAYPKVGPIVINEIMYHPTDLAGNAEYLELKNITGSPVTLYDSDPAVLEPWKITDGIEYTFPSGSPTTIAAGDYFLLIKDLAAFTTQYGAPTAGKYAVWTTGSLSNGGEKVEISMPGDEDAGIRYYIRVDRINYSDGSHPVGDDPWPVSADGTGDSLRRKVSQDYGNDLDNWEAETTPTPGS